MLKRSSLNIYSTSKWFNLFQFPDFCKNKDYHSEGVFVQHLGAEITESTKDGRPKYVSLSSSSQHFQFPDKSVMILKTTNKIAWIKWYSKLTSKHRQVEEQLDRCRKCGKTGEENSGKALVDQKVLGGKQN